jgi:hypothetical protein
MALIWRKRSSTDRQLDVTGIELRQYRGSPAVDGRPRRSLSGLLGWPLSARGRDHAGGAAYGGHRRWIGHRASLARRHPRQMGHPTAARELFLVSTQIAAPSSPRRPCVWESTSSGRPSIRNCCSPMRSTIGWPIRAGSTDGALCATQPRRNHWPIAARWSWPPIATITTASRATSPS